jgi:hypothetical protein
MQNLVGQTVRFSSKNKNEPGHCTRTIAVLEELTQESKRYYYVRDEQTNESFFVIADKYDEFFRVKRSAIAPKHYRETISNTGSADYKK